MVRFSHVGLVVTDLDRSIQFYQEVLGLSCLERYPDKGRGVAIAFLGTGAPALELLCYTDLGRSAREPQGRLDHVAWYVDDIALAMQDLRQKGVVFTPDEPMEVLDGRRIAFFFGPDDERVELVQPAKQGK